MATGKAFWRDPMRWSAAAMLMLGVALLLFWKLLHTSDDQPGLRVLLKLVLAAQALMAVAALLLGLERVRHGSTKQRVLGFLAMVMALPPLALFGFGAMLVGGGGWGRPLRVRGRQVHPELREGAEWEHGARPDPVGLDAPTRAALEALWLHDAQKEHASVPAFARVSWLLAAAGAPPKLLRWSHRAALEEIAHARLCFALAAGYGGRSHAVEAMPELLHAGLGLDGDVIDTLVGESLGDGCQLEDFNADVAAECATVCEEPVTRAGLERIAREERSHADFSWAVVEWLVQRERARARPALERAIDCLASYQRPTAVSSHKRELVERADPAALRRHGRLPDERWAALWQLRLQATRQRAHALLAECEAAAAPS